MTLAKGASLRENHNFTNYKTETDENGDYTGLLGLSQTKGYREGMNLVGFCLPSHLVYVPVTLSQAFSISSNVIHN